MKIYDDISQMAGNTPIVKLNRIVEKHHSIYAKLEFFNPTSSVKDRIAINMINSAEKSGVLKKGGTIVEPTSGNTGLGLAMVAASRGYKLIITMPETMSIERQKLMKHFGAEIILTDGARGMTGAVDKASEIAERSKAFMPQQFKNSNNPQIHYDTTGPEIWDSMNGNIDVFVSGVGTGGTISGTGRYLKERNSDIKIIAVEPATSAVLSGEQAGKHGIQGIGAGFIPDIFNDKVVDEIIKIEDHDAILTAKKLAKLEGIMCGISAGAAAFAAIKVAERYAGKNILFIVPDTGERYLSTKLFE